MLDMTPTSITVVGAVSIESAYIVPESPELVTLGHFRRAVELEMRNDQKEELETSEVALLVLVLLIRLLSGPRKISSAETDCINAV